MKAEADSPSLQQRWRSVRAYQCAVLAYHGLPVLTALVLVGVFSAVFLFTANYILAGAAASIPSALLVYAWVLAGRSVDRLGCPKCGKPFPRRLYLSYPPRLCSSCGEPVFTLPKTAAA
jgi:hypothetical protein